MTVAEQQTIEGRLKRLYDAATRDKRPLSPANHTSFMTEFGSWLKSGQLDPLRINIKQLFVECVPDGKVAVDSWKEGEPEEKQISPDMLQLSLFSELLGIMISSVAMKSHSDPRFNLSAPTRHLRTRLNGERIPGIGNIGAVNTPLTVKGVMLIPLSRQQIASDEEKRVSAEFFKQASDIGLWFAFNKQRRISDASSAVTKGVNQVVYMENWPLSVVAMPGNCEGFSKESVVSFKVSERGAAAVMTTEQADAYEQHRKEWDEELDAIAQARSESRLQCQ